MASLKSLASPNAHVIRSGTAIIIPTAQVCVGDLVELKTGDVVPADLRLTESMNFETDEGKLSTLRIRSHIGTISNGLF